MNSLVRASVRAAVSGVPDFGPACPFCEARDAIGGAEPPTLSEYRRCRECGSFLRIGGAEAAPSVPDAPARDAKYLQSRAAWIRDHLGYAPRRILDLNCREGGFLAAWPWTLRRDGLEADPGLAQRAAAAGFRVFNGPISEFEPSHSYDIVTWYGSVTHGAELKRSIRQVASWVAPAGILAIGMPTLECRRHRFGEEPRLDHWPYRAAALPSQSWIESAVEAQGFQLTAEAWTGGGIQPRRESNSLLARSAGKLCALLADRSPLTQSATFDYYEALFRRL